MISIALIEDNRLVREGIAVLLSRLPDMEVIAAGASSESALLREAHPRVVLLDLGPRNGDSLRLAGRVKEQCPESSVVLMGLVAAQDDVMDFVHAGVAGFVMKDATLDDLANTLRAVAGGMPVLPTQLTGTLFSRIAREAVSREHAGAPESARMTRREREVVGLIGEGLSNKQLAARLHIATHTVKSHVRNVMEKLALHSRLQIAAFAHREEVPARAAPPVGDRVDGRAASSAVR